MANLMYMFGYDMFEMKMQSPLLCASQISHAPLDALLHKSKQSRSLIYNPKRPLPSPSSYLGVLLSSVFVPLSSLEESLDCDSSLR